MGVPSHSPLFQGVEAKAPEETNLSHYNNVSGNVKHLSTCQSTLDSCRDLMPEAQPLMQMVESL